MISSSSTASGISRRRFVGLTAFGLLAGSSCRRTDDAPMPDDRIALGSGDVGALNFAYALEQLESSLFAWINTAFYPGIKPAEQEMLLEIQAHDQAHAALLHAVLGADALGTLHMNFASFDAVSRETFLGAAAHIKDLVVSAYNGLGVYCSEASHLGIISKIASVEARHAAMLREALQPLSFADTSILNPISRIDEARTPNDVLALVKGYFQETLNADKLQLA